MQVSDELQAPAVLSLGNSLPCQINMMTGGLQNWSESFGKEKLPPNSLLFQPLFRGYAGRSLVTTPTELLWLHIQTVM